MFKIGQKVVCCMPFLGRVLKFNVWVKHYRPTPNVNNIYSINRFDADGWLILDEFPNRAMNPNKFRPLDETFAEETLKNIAEQIEQEQLVLI